MANTASARKRIRQTKTRTLRNQARKSRMRTFIKKVETTIAGGEGYWLNAKQAGSVNVTNGNAVSVTTLGPTLIKGWNLVAVGETATPKQFCDAQSGGVTTLWAWDATNTAWYFYAPSLDASGGLSAYIVSKGYRDFAATGKTLGPGVGFWVNRP